MSSLTFRKSRRGGLLLTVMIEVAGLRGRMKEMEVGVVASPRRRPREECFFAKLMHDFRFYIRVAAGLSHSHGM